MFPLLANINSKGALMKFGKDFWFWVRLIIALLKAILGFEPDTTSTPLSAGHRAFNAVCASLVQENEDDDHKAADLKEWAASPAAEAFHDVVDSATQPSKPKGT